ncbi:interferon alpha-1/13-like [Chanos chanos]|uniref:Interferon alpha-1/13-like n=1 Tax=Chanos chanos TaxID=29144 RepID=A0A6J2WZT2_CHACN|nr:interferon alpha-1/13-like [Chanos chanos]
MVFQSFTFLSAMLSVSMVWTMPTTCRLQVKLVETTFNLLEEMTGHFPFQCLPYNILIGFPKAAFQSDSSQQYNIGATKAVYDALKKIYLLFENDVFPDTWDAKTLDVFQNILYRQIEESKCVMDWTQGSQDDFPVRERVLSIFFEKITTYLQEKDFSFCAWETARKELLYALRFILKHASKHILWSSEQRGA